MGKVVGTGSIKVLQDEIRSNVQNVQVITKKNRTTLYIYGILPSTSEEEIKAAVCEETNPENTEVEVTALRPGSFGNNSATIHMPTGLA